MNKEGHPEDNINVPAVRPILFSFFRGFFHFLSFLELVCRKRKWLLLAGLFLGLFLGMFYYYLAQKRYYKASIMMVGTKMPGRVYAGVLNQLNVLARSGSTDKLSTELNLAPVTASNILYFESMNLMQEPLESDTSTKLNETFSVLVGIKNNTAADSIQNALVNYFNNLPYLKKLSEVQRISDSERIQQLTGDLSKLDTLKLQYNKFIGSFRISSSSSSPVYNDAINPAQIYAQTSLLLKEREQARRELYVENNAVMLIDPIKTANTLHSKSLMTLLLLLGSSGFLLGLILGMMVELRKKVLNEPS